MLTKDTKLRFWCQKVLPLVYDDSLSYYELLNKVVLHLNQHTEDINQLIDFYDTFAQEVEEVIEQMIKDGDFSEIVADTLGSIIAEEYSPTESYIALDYCIFGGKLYRANSSTSGVFDPTKWDEKVLANDITVIQSYLYGLKASNISNDSSVTGTTTKDALNTLLNTINEVANRASVTAPALTNTWLSTAKDGEYQITGGDATGSFIDGVDTPYGCLSIGRSNTYGYIFFHSTNGTLYHRCFRLYESTITWLNDLQKINLNSEVSTLSTTIDSKIVHYDSVTISSSITSGQIARIPSSGTDSKLTEDSTIIEITFSNPSAIISGITVNKYDGYMALVGSTGAYAGTADVVIGNP